MSDKRADKSGGLESLQEVVRWCQEAPEGTRLDARTVADLLERVTEADDGGSEPAPSGSVADVLTWREKLWIVPAETRIGVRELEEALDRPKGWIYKRTSAGELPHRKLGGALAFVVGEVRTWIRETEEVEVSAAMESTVAERNLELVEGA